MAADGSVIIDTLVDTSGFGKGMTNIKSQFSGLGSVVKKIGGLMAGVFAVKTLVNFGKQAIELGSDLQEVQNVVDVTFTTMSEKVNEFAQAAAKTAGLSETMAKKYVGTYGAMSKSFGFTEKQALSMSTTLTQLTGDVASFYNLTQDEAYTKLKSVFTGETESLKDLGVVMTQTALDSYALSKGYKKTTSAMTEQEKVALRYQFVMEQLSGAQGDFLRTSDGWANQVRVLKLNVESFMATVGQGLINLLTPVIKVANGVLSLLNNAGKKFLSWTEAITGKKDSVSSGMSSTADSAEQVAGSMEETAAASKKVQSNLSGLDEISLWSSGDDTGEGVADSIVGALGDISMDDVFKSDEIADSLEDAVLDISPEKVGEWLSKGLVFAFNGIGRLIDKIDWGAVGSGVVQMIRGIKWDELITAILRLSGSALRGLGIAIGEGIKEAWGGGNVENWLISLQKNPTTGELDPWNPANYLFNLFEDLANGATDIGEKIVYVLSSGMMGVTEEEAKKMTETFWDALWSGNGGPFDVLFNYDAFEERYREGLQRLSEEERKAHMASVKKAIKKAIEEGRFEDAFETIQAMRESGFVEYIGGTMEDILGDLGLAGEFKEAAKDYSNNLLSWIQTNAPKLQQQLKETIGNQNNLLQDALNSGNTELANIIQGQIEILQARMNQLTAIAEGKTTVIDTSNFAKNFADSFAGVKESAKNVGEDVGNAYTNGLLSVLPEGLRKALQISTLMFNENIDLINEWLSKVLDQNKPTVGATSLLVGSGLLTAVHKGQIQLPHLAKGTVIPPNAPFAAVLGDQRHGTNIEAPLDTIKQAVREVLGEGQSGGGSYEFVAQINRKTLFREIISEAKMAQVQSGKNPFLLT